MVVASASVPSTSLSAGTSRFMDDQRLVEEVLKEFDPAHRLVELSSAWTTLLEGATSFGNMLEVRFLACLHSLARDLPSFAYVFFFFLFFLGVFSGSVYFLCF